MFNQLKIRNSNQETLETIRRCCWKNFPDIFHTALYLCDCALLSVQNPGRLIQLWRTFRSIYAPMKEFDFIGRWFLTYSCDVPLVQWMESFRRSLGWNSLLVYNCIGMQTVGYRSCCWSPKRMFVRGMLAYKSQCNYNCILKIGWKWTVFALEIIGEVVMVMLQCFWINKLQWCGRKVQKRRIHAQLRFLAIWMIRSENTNEFEAAIEEHSYRRW